MYLLLNILNVKNALYEYIISFIEELCKINIFLGYVTPER